MSVGAFGRFAAGFRSLVASLPKIEQPESPDLKGCARLRFATDANKAVVIFHDSVDYRKPQSCSLTRILSSEERLKDAAFHRCIHSHSGILHLDMNVAP